MEINPTKFGEMCRHCIEKGECNAECCGIFIPFPEEIFDKHQNNIQKEPIEVQTIDGKVYATCEDNFCCFLNRKTRECTIYEDRPSVCRQYGFLEDLKCIFIKPNGNMRNLAQRKRTQREVNRFVDNTMKRLDKKFNDKNGIK